MMKRKIFVLLVSIFLLCSCGGLEFHSALKTNSLNFNKSLQHAISEQMLLNLIRLRYEEYPVFLEVGSISTQLSFSGSLGGVAKITKGPESYSIDLGFAYARKPTFTFIPLQGASFAQRLLSPIPIDHLVLLLNSGWRTDRVLRLCVQSINGIPNAPTASGPTPKKAPRFKKFLELTKKLEILRKRGEIKYLYVKKNNKVLPALAFLGKDPLIDKVREELKLTPQPYYLLIPPGTKRSDKEIQVETRSLIGVLFYLSNGIEIPERDIKKGRVVATYYSNGTRFSWKNLLGDIFQVHYSKFLPVDALIAVKYRNYWFYISDEDISTKSTFILLQQLFALEASKGKGFSPLLTLPIGD